jgi:hypothetical protein
MSDEIAEPESDLPQEFRDLVSQALTDLGFTIQSWQSDGLECTDEAGENRSLGLSNLYRRVRAADPSEHEEIVRGFLQVLRQTETLPEAMPESLAEVSDRLLPRLGQSFPEGTITPWSQELIGTDLVVNLVIDSDQYMRYVPDDLIDKSGQDADDWLNLSFKNLKERTPEDWLSVVHEESGVLCGHCNDSYDAARAIIMHQLAETGSFGWLLCVPTRDLVFALPVVKENLQSFHVLKLLAENHFNEDPYPISDKVYWVRGLVWEEFIVELDEEGARVYPSDEFIELLELDEEVETEFEDSEEDYDSEEDDLPSDEDPQDEKK